MASNLQGLRIGIVGYGWLGRRIGKKWQDKNNLYTTTRSSIKFIDLQKEGLNPTLFDFNTADTGLEKAPWDKTSALDMIIITAPISTRKDHVEEHIRRRVQNLSTFIGPFDRPMFFMNSTSVYPQVEQEFKEDDLPIENVLSERLISAKFPQINILRLAGLMGDDRQLGKYNVTNLDAPVNHVHYLDIIGILEEMTAQQSSGKLYNVVAPLHPSKQEVIAAQRNSRETNLGKKTGRIILSDKLQAELDYTFRYPDPRHFHI